MRLVFAVDAIFPPLTGIGRYAWELAHHMERAAEIDDIRFFSMGRWVEDLEGLLAATGRPRLEGEAYGYRRRAAVYLRKYLSRRVWAVQAYSAIAPRWMGYRLRPFRDHLYHSPNFFVPPFDGQSIATIHDLSIYKYPDAHPLARRKMFELEMARTLKQVSHIITDSETTRSEVIDFFAWPESRISAIHIGVDPVFRPRSEDELQPVLARYGLSSGAYALCVSTVEPRKKIRQLLTAYEALPKELQRRCPLVLVGASGWLNSDIHAQMEKGRQAGWVRYLGFVPEADLPLIYAGARAFFYPSIYEGFGLPVLEAMASGIPVLTSDRSSLPEVAAGSARLVDPDDIDALRAGMASTLQDDDWRATASNLGRVVAKDRSWDACAKKTLAVYSAVIGRGR